MTQLAMAVGVEILAGEGRDARWSDLPASELRFSTQDPMAAVLHFGKDEEAIDWTFAFDLVHQVSVGWSNVGIGDVRFSDDPLTRSCVLLRLKSPDGEALLRIRKGDIQKFVHLVKPLLDAQLEKDSVLSALDEAIYAILKDSGNEKPVD